MEKAKLDALGYTSVGEALGERFHASPESPHLHFAIFVLGPEKNRWQGTAINSHDCLDGSGR